MFSSDFGRYDPGICGDLPNGAFHFDETVHDGSGKRKYETFNSLKIHGITVHFLNTCAVYALNNPCLKNHSPLKSV